MKSFMLLVLLSIALSDKASAINTVEGDGVGGLSLPFQGQTFDPWALRGCENAGSFRICSYHYIGVPTPEGLSITDGSGGLSLDGDAPDHRGQGHISPELEKQLSLTDGI